MKQRLHILIQHYASRWWHVTSTKGNPEDTQVGSFTFEALLHAVRHILRRGE